MLIIKDNKNIHMDICIGQPDFREISDKKMHFLPYKKTHYRSILRDLYPKNSLKTPCTPAPGI